MARYDADDVYCIPGTAVLKNKAGITDQEQLDEYEGDFTAIRLLELTQNPVEGSFDLAHLCKIHQYLLQDVYEWAGEVRTVDIIRGDSRFCNVRQIQSYSNTVFSALATEKYLRNLEANVFSKRLAHYLSEINAVHPFREGNGRVQRLFISQLAESVPRQRLRGLAMLHLHPKTCNKCQIKACFVCAYSQDFVWEHRHARHPDLPPYCFFIQRPGL